MALLKYYKLKEKLPKPDGPLSQSIPLSLILATVFHFTPHAMP